jgi:hypothetical protein
MPSPKAQRMCPEEMHMHIARLAMSFELEMVMFEVDQAVAHVFLSGRQFLRTNRFRFTLDPNFSLNGLESRTNATKYQCTSLQPDCAGCLALLNMVATGSPLQMHQRYRLARERSGDRHFAMTYVQPLGRCEKLELSGMFQLCVLLCCRGLRRSHLLPYGI